MRQNRTSGGNERDYWRIIASEDDTKIETVPPQQPIPTLNAGDWFEFGSREHFEIISDKPIMVGQFLASEHAPNPNRRNRLEPGDAATGDPAFILAVPTEQYRPDFVFLAPDKYAFDYVSITAPIESNVFFDDVPIADGWELIGDGSEWRTARFQIGDGVHFLDADQPVRRRVWLRPICVLWLSRRLESRRRRSRNGGSELKLNASMDTMDYHRPLSARQRM